MRFHGAKGAPERNHLIRIGIYDFTDRHCATLPIFF
jgi:hypothetical protein